MSQPMSLASLADELAQRGLLIQGPAPAAESVTFHDITFDPTPLRSGSLYVNLHGDTPQARQRLRDAASCGAVAALIEFTPDTDAPLPTLQVTSPRRALSAAAAAWAGHPSRRLHVIGITGTNGKSTTACMLARIFDRAGIRHGLLSSVYIKAGATSLAPEIMTTPDAPLLHDLLARMVDDGATHAVVEVSSHGLAHERVADVAFDHALITNIDRDHTDFHPTPGHYLQTKARLFAGLPGSGLAFYNADDPAATVAASTTPAGRLGVGRGPEHEVHLDETGVRIGDQAAARLGRPPVHIPLRLRLPGEHNRMNAAGAAALAYAAGVPVACIEEALATFPELRRRLQPIYEGAFRIVDDIACSPGHLCTLFSWLHGEAARYRRLLVITSMRGSRGTAMNHECATLLAQGLPGLKLAHLVVTDSQGELNEFNRVTAEERAAYLEGLQPCWDLVRLVDTNPEACRLILRKVRRGDLVLVVGTFGVDSMAGLLQDHLRRRFRFPWPGAAAETYHDTDFLTNSREATTFARA